MGSQGINTFFDENLAADLVWQDYFGDIGGPTTYNENLSEIVVAGQAATTAVVFVVDRSESVMPVAVQAVALSMPAARLETLASSDTLSAVAIWQLTRADALSASDDSSSAAVVISPLSEEAATTASQIAAGAFSASITEPLAANDDQEVGVSVDGILSEEVSPADDYSATGGIEIQPPDVPPDRHATTSPGLTAATTTTTNRHAEADQSLRSATTTKGRRAA